MGSWKGTCMLSGLPINYHDRIKLIFLKKGNDTIFSAGVCYPNELLKPILLPISGKYDDYGGITECDKDWNYQIISEHFKESYKDGLIIDGSENVETITPELIAYGIERKKMQCKIPDIDPLNERFMSMMRNNATDEELEELKRYENVPKNGWYDANLGCVMILEEVWDNVIKYQGNKISNFSQYGNLSWIDFLHNKFNKYIDGLLFNDEENSRLRRALLRFSSVWAATSESEIKYVTEKYSSFCDENRHDKTLLSNVRKQWSEFSLINKTLQDLRRCWMISSGLGSNQTCYDSHFFLSSMINKMAREKMIEEQ